MHPQLFKKPSVFIIYYRNTKKTTTKNVYMHYYIITIKKY
ncbi:hypothetical protein DSUL_40097 [Desulfovibrionales bacterium]